MAWACRVVIFVTLVAESVMGQAMPSGWTPHYYLRKYSAGANPGADSLNRNWTDIDAAIYNGAKGATTFGGTIVPSVYGTYDFGSTAKYWANGYILRANLRGLTTDTAVVTFKNSAATGLTVRIDQNNATRQWSGIRYDRLGAEKWFSGMDATDDKLILARWKATSNYVTVDSTGALSGVSASFTGLATAYGLMTKSADANIGTVTFATNERAYVTSFNNGLKVQLWDGASAYYDHLTMNGSTNTSTFAGNVLLGTTQTGNLAGYHSLRVGSSEFQGRGTTDELYIRANNYAIGAGDKFTVAGRASVLNMASGVFQVLLSNASGIADGAITWITPLSISTAGNTTLAGELMSNASTGNMYRFKRSTYDQISLFSESTQYGFYNDTQTRYDFTLNFTTGAATFAGTVNFPAGVYHNLAGVRFFAESGSSQHQLFTNSGGLLIRNVADNATLFTLTDAGASTFAGDMLLQKIGSDALLDVSSSTGDAYFRLLYGATPKWSIFNWHAQSDRLDIYSNAGALTAVSIASATGNVTFTGTVASAGVASHWYPSLTDTYDLGSSTKLWRKGWLSEMQAILLAKNTISLLGGWFYVTKDQSTLASDVTTAAADSSIDFSTSMTKGDFVVLRNVGEVEYMQVGELVSGTTYYATRNLDGTGRNAWAKGTPFAVLGYNGTGRIELKAGSSASDTRMSLMTQGGTYNAQTERLRIGDLNGLPGYATTKYGMWLSNGTAEVFHVADDGTTNFAGWKFDTSMFYKGTASLGFALNTSSTAFLTSGTGFEVWDASAPKMHLGTKSGSRMTYNVDVADQLVIYGGTYKVFQSTATGATIGGWTVSTNYLGRGTVNTSGVFLQGGVTNALANDGLITISDLGLSNSGIPTISVGSALTLQGAGTGTITGGTIQTAATGKRMYLDSLGLHADYDDDNETTMDFNLTTKGISWQWSDGAASITQSEWSSDDWILLQSGGGTDLYITDTGILLGGELTLSNTVWDDIQVPLTQGKQGVIDKPVFDNDYVAYKFIKDSTEIIYGSVELPHNWKIGSNLHPHVHLLQTSSADTAQFTLKWKWQSLGGTADATWKYTTLSTREFTYVSGDMMQLVEGDPIDGSAQGLSSVILYQLKRKNAGGLTDSYVYNLGFHYEIDALGSKDELTK